MNYCIVVAVLLALPSLQWAEIQINPEDQDHMIKLASLINQTADPCDDFYQYACTSGAYSLNILDETETNYNYAYHNLLDEIFPIPNEGEPQSYGQKINIYLQSRTNIRNEDIVLPFLNEVKPGNGQEWPFVLDIEEYAQQLQVYRPPEAFQLDVWQLLGDLFSYDFNDVILSYNKIYLRGKAYIELSVPEPSKADIYRLGEILFAAKLPKPLTDAYYNEFMQTHTEIQALYEHFESVKGDAIMNFTTLYEDTGALHNLGKFLKQMLPPPAEIEEASFFFNLSYIQFLFGKVWQPEEARRLCNYFMFQFLIDLMETVEPDYYPSSIGEKFTFGLNYIYFKNFVEPQQQQLEAAASAIIKPVHQHFTDAVFENRLNLAGRQLQEVAKKIDKIRINIGNLPSDVDESMVEEYYSQLPDLNVNNFYFNELAVRRHAHLEILTCPEEMICGETPAKALYNPETNIIAVPFNALALPMFNWTWHPVFSMSLLGFDIAHELVHSIGPEALNKPQSTPSFAGNSLKVPKIFSALKCLNEQNPTEDISDRLADVVGSQLAYDTYEQEFGLQPNFTSTQWPQLYFFSLAQMFCGTVESEPEDSDSNEVRLNEIVMNSKKFAEAFKCPAGSKMNPKTKCTYI